MGSIYSCDCCKGKKQRKQIIDLLESKNLYEESDSLLIDELLYQLILIEQSQISIKNHGILINVRADGPPLLQINQSISLYRDAVKSLITLATKLGITPPERSKLKLIEKKSNLALGKLLGEN